MTVQFAHEPGTTAAKRWLYRFCRRTVELIFRLLYSFTSAGQEHLPSPSRDSVMDTDAGACGGLIIANHQSHLDPPMIAVAAGASKRARASGTSANQRRMLMFIARSGLFRFKPFAWLIAALGAIPLKESESDIGAMKRAIEQIRVGRLVLIFPEGTRSPDAHIHEFKRGVWLLITKARCDVYPAAVHGAFDNWPRHRRFPKLWGHPCRVRFGAPVRFTELEHLDANQGLALLRSRVVDLYRQLEDEHARR